MQMDEPEQLHKIFTQVWRLLISPNEYTRIIGFCK